MRDVCTSNGESPEEVTSLTLDSMCASASVTGLDACVALEELSLIGCGVATLEGFPDLPKLTKLFLNDNRIASGLEHLACLKTLKELGVGGNRIASLDELKPIASLPLTSLDLAGCPCADDSAEYRADVYDMFPSLVYLDGMDADGEEKLMESDEDDDEEEDEDEEDDFDDDDAEDGLDDEDEDDEDEDEDEEVVISDDDDDDDDAAAAAEDGGGGGDDDDEEESDDDDDDDDDDEDELGTAHLLGTTTDDLEEGDDFEADEDPESEDFDEEEEEDDDDEDAGAAKKARVE